MSVKLPSRIPASLRTQAISLDHLGVKEVAWRFDTALEVISALKDTSVAILGGDILYNEAGKLSYTYDNWVLEPGT